MKRIVASKLLKNGCYVKASKINKNAISTVDNEKIIAYLSCRLAISNVKLRTFLIDKMVEKIKDRYDTNNITIVGMATAGVPWAFGIADRLKIPMLYLRSSEKKYGLGGRIEGNTNNIPKNVIIIDDVLYSGNTLEDGKNTLEKNDFRVIGALFIANLSDEFEDKYNDILIDYLTDYREILNQAFIQGIINEEECTILEKTYKKTKRR